MVSSFALYIYISVLAQLLYLSNVHTHMHTHIKTSTCTHIYKDTVVNVYTNIKYHTALIICGSKISQI